MSFPAVPTRRAEFRKLFRLATKAHESVESVNPKALLDVANFANRAVYRTLEHGDQERKLAAHSESPMAVINPTP